MVQTIGKILSFLTKKWLTIFDTILEEVSVTETIF